MPDFEWIQLGNGQPYAATVGNITVYKFPDGHASCAVDQSWISALFVSPEAAISWDGFWDQAEALYKFFNTPENGRTTMLPVRGTTVWIDCDARSNGGELRSRLPWLSPPKA
jgi:hypothetical protein